MIAYYLYLGKSSLVNCLLSSYGESGESSLQSVGPLTAKAHIGSHTTSTAKLFRIFPSTKHNHSSEDNSIASKQRAQLLVVDTPGIREFDIFNSKIVEYGFKEIRDAAAYCKFKNCRHTVNEKGCNVVRSVENDDIPVSRFENYHRLMHTALNPSK